MTFPIPMVRLKNPDNDFFKVLRKARVLIANHSNPYLCNAMRDCVASDAHVELIRAQLWGEFTLNNWILDMTGRWPTTEQARETRLRWIDSMLSQEYK